AATTCGNSWNAPATSPCTLQANSPASNWSSGPFAATEDSSVPTEHTDEHSAERSLRRLRFRADAGQAEPEPASRLYRRASSAQPVRRGWEARLHGPGARTTVLAWRLIEPAAGRCNTVARHRGAVARHGTLRRSGCPARCDRAHGAAVRAARSQREADRTATGGGALQALHLPGRNRCQYALGFRHLE